MLSISEMISIFLLFFFLTVAALGDVIPSEFQAAALSKQLLFNQSVGNLMVKLAPENAPDEKFNDFPFGQVELSALDCKEKNAILIFSSLLEVTTESFVKYKNQVTMNFREEIDDSKIDALLKHRVTVLGHAEPQPWFGEPGYQELADCFFAKHPDARAWEHLGNHDFRFYKVYPEALHYVGGFGNSHYIGWISQDNWAKAPATAQCKDWPGCPNTDDKCCPYDDDNAMQACCVRDAPSRIRDAVGNRTSKPEEGKLPMIADQASEGRVDAIYT